MRKSLVKDRERNSDKIYFKKIEMKGRRKAVRRKKERVGEKTVIGKARNRVKKKKEREI